MDGDSMIRCAIARIVVLLGCSPLLAQDLAAPKSQQLPHTQNEMSQAAAHQHALPQARTTLWQITLGASLRQLPDCAEDTPLPENTSICLFPSLPAHPPYSWLTINNSPYRSAQLAQFSMMALWKALTPSLMDLGVESYRGACRRNLRKPACTSRALVEEREHGSGTRVPTPGFFTGWISMRPIPALWLHLRTLPMGQRYRHGN